MPAYIQLESYQANDPRAFKDSKWFEDDFCEGPGQILFVHATGDIAPCCGFRLFGDEFRGDFHDARNGRWLASFDLVRDYDGWDYRYNYYVKKGYVWADEDDDVATDSIGKN